VLGKVLHGHMLNYYTKIMRSLCSFHSIQLSSPTSLRVAPLNSLDPGYEDPLAGQAGLYNQLKSIPTQKGTHGKVPNN
jgi:cystathionine beta-lyase family protein involved in aluminum resistance